MKKQIKTGDGAEVLGFGFVPAESQHHFLVTLAPKREDDQVYISEHFAWDESDARRELHFALGREDDKMKVVLPRPKWDALAEATRTEFNRRLREQGYAAARWTTGQTPVSRLLGKELLLLCWAVEDADPALIPRAIRNWRGLAPEERWWLFTMTNAATGHATGGRGKGWRKAVRFALTENPVSASSDAPEHREMRFGLFRNVAPDAL